MKKVSIITIILGVFILTSAYAAEFGSLAAPKAISSGELITVPLELENTQEMAALDLPLEFSEGVTLQEVVFEGTRSESFDFKYARIDNENHNVVIGMIPMVFGEKPDLAPGEGVIAKMVFQVNDPTLAKFELKTTTMESPSHAPLFVYTDFSNGRADVKGVEPAFEDIVIALADVPQAENPIDNVLPTEFALKQNAPNPFNPTTMIGFDLPAPAYVKLEILNILGQKVKTLVDEQMEAGSHSVEWNGTDNTGSAAASGVYFYRIQAGDNYAVKKMMMLK
jgi:hypothetical protein